jgi:hypothetical protein
MILKMPPINGGILFTLHYKYARYGPHKRALFATNTFRKYPQNGPFLIKKGHFIVFFAKNNPILPKIAKYGLKTNSRPY